MNMVLDQVQYIDVKALMGDKSDNIPGVPGVLVRRLHLSLLKTYGSWKI